MIIKFIAILVLIIVCIVNAWTTSLVIRNYKLDFIVDDFRNDLDDRMHFSITINRNHLKTNGYEEYIQLCLFHYSYMLYACPKDANKPLTKKEAYNMLNEIGYSDKEIEREFPHLQDLSDYDLHDK